INLLSNNPDKINQLEKYGIKIENRIPINEEINDFNKLYLKTKKDKMGHLLDII
ncbi:bifunctional 3,4-dihydroxy-2-butanone-4-phosphate synthase/GTP cyclohydrolase II, partial [Clostridioides difficile]|nr:bifunctional 3,4-dihydroxy-2-butanone-4-phosphate synthase/GTP cyclohydrolase II [Clostridioides difficile]